MNEFQLNIENLEDRLLLSGSVVESADNLFVFGTSSDDVIEVRQIGSELRILINDFDHGMFQMPDNRINVSAFDGDDNVLFQATVTADALVDAGAGDDIVRTGAGNDSIVGERGNDILIGRSGNDVIHGDVGNDKLWGQAGDGELLHINIEING